MLLCLQPHILLGQNQGELRSGNEPEMSFFFFFPPETNGKRGMKTPKVPNCFL